ncbi:MAG: hypothetical protein IT366_19580 [Candidatus Hydrogenedentes bacterium]|nr:hypothetical protein [Candidatus Hydrogenedentota bacterium]
MTASDYAAWLGAVTGVLAFVHQWWSAWKSGPQLKAVANTGMKVMQGMEVSKETYAMIEVRNTGDRGTMILSAYVYSFSGNWLVQRWKRYMQKPDQSFFLKSPGSLFGTQFPFLLEAGTIWNGAMNQETEIESEIKKGNMWVVVHCVDGDAFARLKLNPPVEVDDPKK